MKDVYWKRNVDAALQQDSSQKRALLLISKLDH